MMKKKVIIAALAVTGMFSMASAMSNTNYQIYKHSCANCHGDQAQGIVEKKAPPLNTMSREDLVVKLSALKGTDYENHSKTMESNQRVLEKKGMQYDVMKMATYIYYAFSIEEND